MKRKLFVFQQIVGRYKTINALEEDGRMLMTSVLETSNPEFILHVFYKDNKRLSDVFEVIIIDQESLDKHLYFGAPRDVLRKDFQHAWDRYKGLDVSAN